MRVTHDQPTSAVPHPNVSVCAPGGGDRKPSRSSGSAGGGWGDGAPPDNFSILTDFFMNRSPKNVKIEVLGAGSPPRIASL